LTAGLAYSVSPGHIDGLIGGRLPGRGKEEKVGEEKAEDWK